MFAKRFVRLLNEMILLIATALLSSASVYAQTVFILDEPHLNVSPLSFRIELAVEDTGRVQGAVIPIAVPTDMTLIRRVIENQPDGSVVGTYETELSQSTEDGRQPVGDLTVQLQGAAGDNGDDDDGNDGIDIIVWDVVGATTASELDWLDLSDLLDQQQDTGDGDGDGDSDGDFDIIVWDVVGAVDSETDFLELRLAPASSTEQLTCEPTHLCNTPSPGQDLIVVFPEPLPGEPIVEDLIVHHSEWEETRVIQVRLQYLF